MDKPTNIIIPCAGKGTRLKIPYPKSMMAVGFDRTIIDYSFDLLYRCSYPLMVTVVINKNSIQLVEYLDRYKEDFNIVFAYQNEEYPDLVGAIKSVEHLFQKTNIVLLPDTIVKTKDDNHDILGESIRHLKEQPLLYWVKRETDQDVLRREGAVTISNQEKFPTSITILKDKPVSFDDTLSGFWAAFGFNKNSASFILQLMEDAILHKKTLDFVGNFGCEIPAIEVQEALDLGAWSSVYEYFGAQGRNKVNQISRK